MTTKSVLLTAVVAACLCAAWQLGCGQRTPSPAAPAADEVRLPEPTLKGQMSVEETLARRRSVRQFDGKDLTMAQVGQLAWAAQGITDPATGHRTAPSAGALYPLELYLVKRDGAFRYVPRGHRLVPRSDKDLRGQLSQAALGQSSVREAPLDIVITGVYERTRVKYGDRAERYVHIEAGHVAQNIHLQAVALGLGSVSVGAFRDDEVAKVLNLPTGETPLYIIPVGARR
jgi:SagB-type dehydrogenase family enzyme